MMGHFGRRHQGAEERYCLVSQWTKDGDTGNYAAPVQFGWHFSDNPTYRPQRRARCHRGQPRARMMAVGRFDLGASRQTRFSRCRKNNCALLADWWATRLRLRPRPFPSIRRVTIRKARSQDARSRTRSLLRRPRPRSVGCSTFCDQQRYTGMPDAHPFSGGGAFR